MSARLDLRRTPRPFAAALETTFAAGGWTNALIVLGMLAGPVMARVAGGGKAAYAGLVLAAMFTMFWAMLAGCRLVALCATAAAQRLPYWRRQAWRYGAAALLMAVLLPAVLQTLDSAVGYPLAVAALGTGAALGLFWASMPPWTMWLLIAAGAAARWLPGEVDEATLQAWLGSAAGLGGIALALLAASAACWAWLGSRREPPGPWSRPLAMAMASGTAAGTGIHAQQAAYGSPLFAMDTPVGSELHRAPQQALAIALGPGFGRGTLKAALATHGPILAVALFWLLLDFGADGGKTHVGLVFAPLMVLATALAPALRLQALFTRPVLGLHELALLPGLPRRPAPALASQLARQAIVRGLPALAVMAGFGLAVGAPRLYYVLLPWTCAGSLCLLSGATLLSLHSRPGRWACVALMILVTLGVIASMMAAMRGHPPSWLQSAWSVALIAGVFLQGAALARIGALPHPWLQN